MDSALVAETGLGPVRRLRIGRAPGLVVDVLDLGATLTGVWVTTGDEQRNVVLSLPTAQDYLDAKDYAGAVVGRYANRIAGAEFTLDGHRYEMTPNEGRHLLHGGRDGFHRRIWTVTDHDDRRVCLRLVSPDGDQGFPGELTAEATYAVSGSTLSIELAATTDAPTYASLTSHGYWNLDASPTIEDHLLRVHAERYLPVDDELIPTGEVRAVHDEFDLRRPQRLGERFLDHTFVLGGRSRTAAPAPTPAVTLRSGGLRLEVATDAPGIQVHTADKYTGTPRSGLALEPQLFPDSPHHPQFPSAVLRPGRTFRSTSRWRVTGS